MRAACGDRDPQPLCGGLQAVAFRNFDRQLRLRMRQAEMTAELSDLGKVRFARTRCEHHHERPLELAAAHPSRGDNGEAERTILVAEPMKGHLPRDGAAS